MKPYDAIEQLMDNAAGIAWGGANAPEWWERAFRALFGQAATQAQPATHAEVLTDEREAFEAWLRDRRQQQEPSGSFWVGAHAAWDGWRARAAIATQAAQQPTVKDDLTVPWPVVTAYSGGASREGVAGRVWLRLGDGPEEVEYVPAQQPAVEPAYLSDGRQAFPAATVARWSPQNRAQFTIPLYAAPVNASGSPPSAPAQGLDGADPGRPSQGSGT